MTPGGQTNPVEKVVEAVATDYPEIDTGNLRLYMHELFSCNPQIGLVSKKHTESTVTRLIRLSISMWRYTFKNAGENTMRDGVRIIDIGTGGGIPGLIWKIIMLIMKMSGKNGMVLQKNCYLIIRNCCSSQRMIFIHTARGVA